MSAAVAGAVKAAALLAILSCSATAAEPAYAYGMDAAAGSWLQTFSDDFSGTALNTSLWRVRVNESHCEPCEPQLYLPDRLSVGNGSLTITTQRDHVLGPGGVWYNFSSGWLDTKSSFSQMYGLFECSVQLPSQNATGIWPAFWTLPVNDSVCWPMGGEIDAFEYTANPILNQVYGSYRWGTSCGNDEQILPGAGYPPLGAPPIDWSSSYHVIAVQWNATALTFYVDGVAYETKTPSEVVFPVGAQYVILDAAVAWYFMPGPDATYPAQTLWDYVRVFQWEAAGAA